MKTVLKQLVQTLDYVMPFNLETPGIEPDWWGHIVGPVWDQPSEFFSVEIDGTEVARAEVERPTIDGYVGVAPGTMVVELVFFEVRESHRRLGLGREAVAMIMQHYGDEVFAAFSEDADDFWAGIGWRSYPRIDGDAGYRTLFMHHPTVLSLQAGD